MSKVLSIEFEKLKEDLIAAYDQKGMRASGKFADSLEVKKDDFNVQLWGNSYAQQLETGRQGGTYPNIDAIRQWIDDKNIAANIDAEITKNQLAFLIARKIWREGWNREGYGGVELISEVVTDQRIDKIIKEVGVEQALIFSTEIEMLIKELV